MGIVRYLTLDPSARLRLEDLIASLRLSWRRTVRSLEALVVPLLLVGGVLLLVFAVQRFFAWNLMVQTITEPDKRVAAENQILLTLAQIFGGGFVLTGLYFTSKTYVVGREAHVTQRLSAAIESLASNDLSRRVAGIYSLESLLRNPSVDYQAVIGILTGFIRAATEGSDYQGRHEDKPRADVQAALDTLARRPASYRHGERFRLDLRRAYLRSADFSRGNFQGVLFDGADLTKASFFRAHLEYASFEDAYLEDVILLQADLRYTTFYHCRLSRTPFRRSLMKQTNLTMATLSCCSFDSTTIKDSTFGGAVLLGATFDDSRLARCNFARVSRKSVDLTTASKRKLVGFVD